MKAHLANWLASLLLGGILISGWLWATPGFSGSYPIALTVQTTFTTPPVVERVATLLGINLSHIHVIYGNIAPCNEGGDYVNPIACYDVSNNSMYFADFTAKSQADQAEIVAHEYMHYVWSRLSTVQQNLLIPGIKAVYLNHSKELNQRLTGYILSDDQRINELHSFECSEMANSELPTDLRSHCLEYIPNHKVLTVYY